LLKSLERLGQEEADRQILIEDFIPGTEVALEELLTNGELRPLAMFDKPDLLDGPYFEETIYVTPSRLTRALQKQIHKTLAQAALTDWSPGRTRSWRTPHQPPGGLDH